MKILFLTDNFLPESNAPASRTFEHAKQWVEDGHEVTVITCAPNFPAGKLFDGYHNRWFYKESMSGINVVRVKTYITANEGFVKRTLDYLSFMVTGSVAALFQARSDVVVATSPQFFTAVAGYVVSKLKRTAFVFELRDLWPASITAVGAMEPGRMIRMLEKLELFLYCKADLIVSVTDAFRRELIDRGISAEKIAVVTNGVDLEQYQPTKHSDDLIRELQLQNAFVVGYIGTHGMAHGLPKVIEAASLLTSHQDIVFLFVGDGAARAELEDNIRQRQLSNIRLLPMQPKSRMPQIWSICNVALIPLRDKPLFTSVIPSKLFECMGMGIPVIMSIPDGEATDIVRKTECGVVVPPENPRALADAISGLRGNPSKMHQLSVNGMMAAKQFSRSHLARTMLKDMIRTVENK